MTLQLLLLLIASIVGGVINSVAGGGTLIVFPALLSVGVAPVAANATNTMALWPGTLASSFGYRRQLGEIPHPVPMSIIALLGGIVGAVTLVVTPESVFQLLVPYLLLLATALFALSGPIARLAAHSRFSSRSLGARQHLGVMLGVQLLVSLYGGYFGAGIGLMMLAAYSLLGFKNIHSMNAAKTLLASMANGAAVLTFIASGSIDWRYAPVMLIGSITGGYAGSIVAQRLDQTLVRRVVVVFGAAVTAWYFFRAH